MIALVGPGNARDHVCALRLAEERGAQGFRCYLLGTNALLAAEPWVRSRPGADVNAVVQELVADGVSLVLILDPVLLIAGAAERFREAGLPTIGPGLAAAAIEGSKALMKQVIDSAGIAAPASALTRSPAEAEAYIEANWSEGRRFALKVDSYLADANVRTLLPANAVAARSGARAQFAALAQAGQPPGILIERRIDGWETSVHILWDGQDYLLLPPVRDYKSVRDGDLGPNTHGAAALACGRGFAPQLEALLRADVIAPALAAMKAMALDYPGFVYFGVMIADGRPQVLEINVRPGNPEMLVLLGLLKSEFAELLERCAEGTLGSARPEWHADQYCGAVFALADGYPETARFEPVVIDGLENADRHGLLLGEGIAEDIDGRRVVASGRVVAAMARSAEVEAVREAVFGDLAAISFAGKHHRSDLGAGIWAGLFSAAPLV